MLRQRHAGVSADGSGGRPRAHRRRGFGWRRPPPARAAAREAGGSRGVQRPLPDRDVQHGVGWLTCLTGFPCAEQTRPPALAALGRPNLHATTFSRLLFALSTRGNQRISHEVQRRIGARPGSANGLFSPPGGPLEPAGGLGRDRLRQRPRTPARLGLRHALSSALTGQPVCLRGHRGPRSGAWLQLPGTASLELAFRISVTLGCGNAPVLQVPGSISPALNRSR